MRYPIFHSVMKRHRAWLLWLALLLPLAQMAATWHGLSHLGQPPSSESAGKHAPSESGHCDRCLAAATIGGALPAGTPTLPMLAARHALSPVGDDRIRFARHVAVYRSRAPPVALD